MSGCVRFLWPTTNDYRIMTGDTAAQLPAKLLHLSRGKKQGADKRIVLYIRRGLQYSSLPRNLLRLAIIANTIDDFIHGRKKRNVSIYGLSTKKLQELAAAQNTLILLGFLVIVFRQFCASDPHPTHATSDNLQIIL